jgi:hypothetical protein
MKHDTSEDVDALMATHDSHRQALEIIHRHRLPSSPPPREDSEDLCGLGGVRALVTAFLAVAVAVAIPLAAAVVRNAPELWALAMFHVQRLLAWLQ